jgi:hypothetical protein
MRSVATICLGLFLGSMPLVGACQEGWNDEAGRRAEDTDARKSQAGFGGWIVVTSDADWRTQWESSPETVPRITEAKAVKRGQTVFVLIFFSNPLLHNGTADVTCDIEVTRPDRTNSIHQPGTACFKGKISEDPHHLFLSGPVIKFIGEPHDLAGDWVVNVTLRDNARDVELALKTSFKLEE